jgi:hypothetical protein
MDAVTSNDYWASKKPLFGTGVLVGGIAYAISYPWINAHILSVWKMGEISLPEFTGIPTIACWIILPLLALAAFSIIEKVTKKQSR